MITDILLYLLFFAGYTVILGLLLMVFISAFFRSKIKSMFLLLLFILINVFNLNTGFDFSTVMGVGMIVILVVLSILALIIISNRLRSVEIA